MPTNRIASGPYGKTAVSRDGMGARDFAAVRAGAEPVTTVTATTAEQQRQDAQIQLHENWNAGQGNGKVRRERRSFHFEKIARALRDELEAGGTVTGLRPVELRRRLITRMLLRGLKESEIPSVRVFGRYFGARR